MGNGNYFAVIAKGRKCERKKQANETPRPPLLILTLLPPSSTPLPPPLSRFKDRLELVVRVTLVTSRSRVDLGGDGGNSGLEGFALLVVVLGGSGGTELLEPLGGLLELSLDLLDVGTLELASETLLVGELALERVDEL